MFFVRSIAGALLLSFSAFGVNAPALAFTWQTQSGQAISENNTTQSGQAISENNTTQSGSQNEALGSTGSQALGGSGSSKQNEKNSGASTPNLSQSGTQSSQSGHSLSWSTKANDDYVETVDKSPWSVNEKSLSGSLSHSGTTPNVTQDNQVQSGQTSGLWDLPEMQNAVQNASQIKLKDPKETLVDTNVDETRVISKKERSNLVFVSQGKDNTIQVTNEDHNAKDNTGSPKPKTLSGKSKAVQEAVSKKVLPKDEVSLQNENKELGMHTKTYTSDGQHKRLDIMVAPKPPQRKRDITAPEIVSFRLDTPNQMTLIFSETIKIPKNASFHIKEVHSKTVSSLNKAQSGSGANGTGQTSTPKAQSGTIKHKTIYKTGEANARMDYHDKDSQSIILDIRKLNKDQKYVLTVRGIQDMEENTISPKDNRIFFSRDDTQYFQKDENNESNTTKEVSEQVAQNNTKAPVQTSSGSASSWNGQTSTGTGSTSGGSQTGSGSTNTSWSGSGNNKSKQHNSSGSNIGKQNSFGTWWYTQSGSQSETSKPTTGEPNIETNTQSWQNANNQTQEDKKQNSTGSISPPKESETSNEAHSNSGQTTKQTKSSGSTVLSGSTS